MVNEMVETILSREPDYITLIYEPTTGLAKPQAWLDKEWKVPLVGSGSHAPFWHCAHELENMLDIGEAIPFVQKHVTESIRSICTHHASWLKANAAYHKADPTVQGANTALGALTKAHEDLQNAKNTYWRWKFLLSGLEGPVPSYVNDLSSQLAALRLQTNTRLTVVEDDVRAIQAKSTEIDALKAEITQLRELIASAQIGAPPLTPPPSANPSIQAPQGSLTTGIAPKPVRVPPPKFDGTKEGTKVTTWFEQFDDYSTIMQIAPCDLVANASLCLTGRAAEQWALMKKSLVQRGKDPRDFATFKSEMLSQFVEGKVEHTVRVRLARLKHIGSVAAYHAAFRAIMVEAVTHPISGPEACAAFRSGLKPAVYQLVMRDPQAKDEFEHLDVVVKAAKEAEDMLAVIAGASHTEQRKDHPRKDDRPAPRKDNKRRMPPLARQGGKKPAKSLSGPDVTAEKDKWVKKGLPEAVFNRRHMDSRCYQCGSLEHHTPDCTEKGIVLPPGKK